jgi:hypothetical protein
MRTTLTILIGVLALTLAELHLASPDSGLNLPVNTHQNVTATIALGIEEPIGLLTSTQVGTSTTYSDGNYQIQITENINSKVRSIIRVIVKKTNGESFRMNNFSITVRVPRNSIQGIWYPGADPSDDSVMAADAAHSVDDTSDANFGIPYIAAASSNLKNVFAMGLSRQDLAVSIGGQPVDRSFYEFRLKALTARTAATFDERFYVSADPTLNWYDTAANYSDWTDVINKYQPFPISPRAYEPLYDTWYWSEDRVDDRLYKETAKLASDAGMGLYLADSGWDTATGEYEKWLGGKTGDYSPPPEKFTSLAETFNEIRSRDNMGIDLWLQPFAVGRQSRRYAGTRNMHIQLPQQRYASMGWSGLAYPPFVLPLGSNLENVNLCPRMSSTETYLKNLFTDVATKYNPEGYWLDFIDGMPTYCIASHNHSDALFGDGFKRSLDTIKSTILSFNPQAVVHFRARYANLNTKPFANVWQSGDSPGNFDQMRLNTIRLHPFSKGVVFAADQTYWPEGTSETEVSKFIMTSVMVGVPSFGPALISSPANTFAMLKAWITFYRNNKTDLATGRFSIFGQLNTPNHKIEGTSRTFVYLRNLDFSELATGGRTVFLMNATDGDRLTEKIRVPGGQATYTVTVLNRFLVPEAGQMRITADQRGVLNVNLAVQQGGMVILTPETEPPATLAAGDL